MHRADSVYNLGCVEYERRERLPSKVTTLEELLSHNANRLAVFRGHALFTLLEDGTLDDPPARNTLLAFVQRFSTNFQALLFIRQGFCADPRFHAVFLKHLNEEIGHDAMLAKRPNAVIVDDTLFEATLGWFNYQMMVLDNVDRVVLMHFVLETAGDYFHNLASGRLARDVASSYFDAHAEVDADHAAAGVELVQGHSSATYERLGLLLDAAWNMLEAAFGRVHCRIVSVREGLATDGSRVRNGMGTV
jgi:hypothetical protein